MKNSLPPVKAADHDDDDDGSCFSPFSCLQDDVVLEIFKKIIDLKTLCVCEVVSKRFYEIAHKVDFISYTDPFSSISDSYTCKYFPSVMTSLKKFVRVKSLCIRCPSPSITYNNNDSVLYKWKVKMGKNRVDSLVFVSTASIYDKKNELLLYGEQKEDLDRELALKVSDQICFYNSCLSIVALKQVAWYFPLLEKVSITDLDNWARVSVNGREKVDELRNYTDVAYFPRRKTRCYVPLLELPGYVMKGVTLFLVDWDDVPNDVTYDSFINDDIDFKHDKQEVAAYHEAIKEIFKKHRGSFV